MTHHECEWERWHNGKLYALRADGWKLVVPQPERGPRDDAD